MAAKAIVLGGYGLIGAACCRALIHEGYAVTAIGRSREAARHAGLDADWIFRDLAEVKAAEWCDILSGASVVVNAAGALQDGARDDLAAIHDLMIGELVTALEGHSVRVIQISAVGVAPDAATEFLRTKACGDARLIASSLDWVILRPALVIAPEAYGGTALVRAAAAVPGVFLRVLPEVPVQTVGLPDLAGAVVQAAKGGIADRTIADLAEPESRSLSDTVVMMRAWLGFPRWRFAVTVPSPLLTLIGRGADALVWLGWRSPLRTNALITLAQGIAGSPGSWIAAGGTPLASLPETLARMPATAQERWFARLYLLMPVIIATLSIFWMASGLVALGRLDASASVLTRHGVGPGLAAMIVIGGAVIDIALGLLVLWRRLARVTCLAMAAASAGYLLGGLILAPDLWADPLGPMLKVLPGIVLALVAASLLDER